LPHYAVLLHAHAAVAQSFVILADAVTEDADRGDTVFMRDGAVVHRVPTRWVAGVSAFDHALPAREAVNAHRTQLGGATIHVRESASPAPRRGRSGATASAVPAEGIVFRIDEA